MSKIIACIDGSPLAGSVCDHSAWLAHRLALPITLLHVLERSLYPTSPNTSGAIGLGSREHLLEALARLDEQRARLARADGEALLAGALQRLHARGVATAPTTLQRHDYLADTLRELEAELGVLVIGKRGEHSGSRGIGSQLETVVRMLHKPILVCAADFIEPRRFLVAYDGSETTHQGLLRVAKSLLLSGLEGEILQVGDTTPARLAGLEAAADLLRSCGSTVTTHLVAGHPEEAIPDRVHATRADLLVMGAYSHSAARRFLLGSQTSHMLRHTDITTLVLRA